MSIKKIDLVGNNISDVYTEIMFEVASARAEGVELICFNISDESIQLSGTKYISSIIKKLRDMKQRGHIQFFATVDLFERAATEAVFLINKYPSHFDSVTIESLKNCIYIKL